MYCLPEEKTIYFIREGKKIYLASTLWTIYQSWIAISSQGSTKRSRWVSLSLVSLQQVQPHTLYMSQEQNRSLL